MKSSFSLRSRLACRPTMRQQSGNILMIVIIVIIAGMFFLSCYDPKKVNSLPSILPNSTQTVSSNQPKPSVYTVQVAATADKARAYEIKQAFINDGFQPRVDVINYGRDSVMYKVRIGKYVEETDAEQLRNRIQRAYRANYRDSFVYAY